MKRQTKIIERIRAAGAKGVGASEMTLDEHRAAFALERLGKLVKAPGPRGDGWEHMVYREPGETEHG